MAEIQTTKEAPHKKPTSYLLSLFNPVKIFRAVYFHHKQKKYIKASHDLELKLYSEILSNDMLHYGYFEDVNIEPEKLSFYDVETAQVRYAEKLISHIRDRSLPVLDIGCGIGGIANLLHQHGFQVEVLSPNINQINYVKKTYPHLPSHNLKFANMYVTRIVNPILFYLESKLLIKLAWLHHLSNEIRERLSTKLDKEFAKLDTETFVSEKKYMILVLEK